MNFLTSFLCGLFGSGVGGSLVWLAAQKVIDDRIEKKQEVVWGVIDKIKEEYQPKYACEITHKSVDKDNKRIEDSLLRIEKAVNSLSRGE